MKIIVVNRRPSGCDPHSATLTPLGASTPSQEEDGCFATIFPGLSWESACAADITVNVVARVYYDLPTPTLMWTGASEPVSLTVGSGFAALTPLGPIPYDLSTGGSGIIYRITYTITYPDTSIVTRTTEDDFTGSCT